MSFVTKLGRAFPKLKPACNGVASPTKNLKDLRLELWNVRTEYWIRKAQNLPKLVPAAKGELANIAVRMKKPGEITYRELAHAGIWGVQIFGCFCIGEMWGRGAILGYPVERNPYSEMH